jgi:hypothetical protein
VVAGVADEVSGAFPPLSQPANKAILIILVAIISLVFILGYPDVELRN